MTTFGRIALITITTMTAAKSQQIAVPFEKYRLDNGMCVILHEDHRLPIVAVNLWYGVGGKDEPPGRSGFAHLFEHLMFMGTWRAPAGDFDLLMEAGGGSNNATTSEDRTNYFSWGPSNLLPTLLWLEADRLEHLGAAMTQEKLDLQREVVRNERRQSYENEPYGMAELEVNPLIYPAGHPYALPVIGSHADLVAATVKDVQDFFATWYAPNNASLVVAGDFDADATKKLIADLFGTLPRRPDPPHRDAAPVRIAKRIDRAFQDPGVEFTRISMVWHSPKAYAAGDAECDLLAKILTDGIVSRLQKRLIYDETLAHAVVAYQASQRLGSMFRIDAIVPDGVAPEKVEAAIDAELRKIRDDGPTEAELTRVKAQILTEDLLGLQRVLERADRLNAYENAFGDPNGFERDAGRYRDATRDGVRDWARRVLDPDARLVMRVVPDPTKKRTAAHDEGDEDAEEGDEGAETRPATPSAETRPSAAPSARDQKPGLGSPRAFRPAVPATFAIGPDRVLLQERGGLPLVRIVLRVDGGANLDPAGKGGLSDLTAHLLREGAGKRDALAFAEAIDQLGAHFDVASDHDSTLFQLTVLRSNFGPAIELMLDALLEPRFDEAAFKRVKTQVIAGLKQRDEQPSLVGRIAAQALLFGRGHPVGRPVAGTVASVETITRDDIRAFWKDHMGRDMQVLAAGSVKDEDLRAAFATRLAARPRNPDAPRVTTATPVARAEKLRVAIVDRPGAPQTVIRFAWPGILYGDERRGALSVASVVLGGTFTSRLNYNLREQKGYTYGAGAGVEYYQGSEHPARGPSVITASSAVRADVTGAAVREFLAEFDRMRKGDITSEELEKARSSIRNNRVQAGEGLEGLVSEIDTLVTLGLAPDALAQDLARIEAVTLADANAAARAILNPDGGVLVLVGDAASIRKQLDNPGLPKPEVVTLEQLLQ